VSEHIVHLGTADRTACGALSKWTAGSAAAVTCLACKATWAFSDAVRRGRAADKYRRAPDLSYLDRDF